MFRKLDATLFYGLLLPRFSKTYAGAAPVLVDELNTGAFQGAAYRELVSGGKRSLVIGDLSTTDCVGT